MLRARADARAGRAGSTTSREGRFDPRCPGCGRALDVVRVEETAPLDPRSVYAATKLHQEHLCAAYGREHAAPVIALRYHNVYGPRMPASSPYSGVAAIFRSAYEQGRAPQVFEDGGQLRDFVHVDDVARANVLALTGAGLDHRRVQRRDGRGPQRARARAGARATRSRARRRPR